jgi:hypothetical protein
MTEAEIAGEVDSPMKPARAYTGSPTSTISLLTLDMEAGITTRDKRDSPAVCKKDPATDCLGNTTDVESTELGKPERKQWLIMLSLSFISFMVSLDATILVRVLPVSCWACCV